MSQRSAGSLARAAQTQAAYEAKESENALLRVALESARKVAELEERGRRQTAELKALTATLSGAGSELEVAPFVFGPSPSVGAGGETAVGATVGAAAATAGGTARLGVEKLEAPPFVFGPSPSVGATRQRPHQQQGGGDGGASGRELFVTREAREEQGLREEDFARMMNESVAEDASEVDARLAASGAVQVAELDQTLRLTLASPAGGLVSSREEMVRNVAGSTARRLVMSGDGESGGAAEAGAGAGGSVPKRILQRVPGANVGEDGASGHSIPGKEPIALSNASRFGGRGRGKGAMRPSVGGRGILNVGGRGLGDRATVKPQHKMSLKAKPPSTPQCKVSQKKDSPDSVIAGVGGGGGGGDEGPDDGGPPGDGGGDPTFDSEGRSEAILNKALAALSPSSHLFWRIVHSLRLSMNGNDLEEAGDFISKLLSMGYVGLVGITDKVDANNAEERGISAKRHQMSGHKVDSCATLFDRLQKTDSYKSGVSGLAQRIADTGRTVVPLVVFKELLVSLSQSGVMNTAGCNLEAIVHGLDPFLIKQNVSFVAMEGEVQSLSSFALVDGLDFSSTLQPLPAALGEKKLVSGVNDTGFNTTRTLTILAQAAQKFITLELEKRAGECYNAPVVKPLSSLTPQAKLNLLSADVLRVIQSFQSGQYIIALTMLALAYKIEGMVPPGSCRSHLQTTIRHIELLMSKSNEGFASPVILGADLVSIGHSALSLGITAVGTLAVQAFTFQHTNGDVLVSQAQMSAAVLGMGSINPKWTPQEMLEHVIVTAGSGLEHGGVDTDIGSVSRAVINLVIGMLQLLQLDHVLNDDVRKLLKDLELYSAKAQELSTTMPQEVGRSLTAWKEVSERTSDALEGICGLSESGEGLHGHHGVIALSRSLLDGVCISPKSVEAWHDLVEPPVTGEAETGTGGANETGISQDIQVVDLMRHMGKAHLQSLSLCDDLVRLLLQNVSKYTNGESERVGKNVLNRLGEMNDSPLTLNQHVGSRRSPQERLKKLIGTVSQDRAPRTGVVPTSPGVYALWGKATSESSKSAVLDMLEGSPSRLVGHLSPKIEFGELKSVALEHKWGHPRSEGSHYIELLKVAPFGIQDTRFQELSLWGKAAFLMVFPGEMEKFDSTAARKYVAMLDAYKKACGDERVAKKTADGLLKKAGHVAMFAGFTNLDYDGQFPERGSPQQVAFLSHQVEQFQSQLKSVKDASAAEAAEAASKLEEEQEAAREAECCRGLLEFLSAGGATLEPATREQLLGEYLASRGESSPGL